MEQDTFFTHDLGPGIYGISMKIGDKVVCVVSPDVLKDHATQRAARELLRRQGVDIAPTGPDDSSLDAA